MLHSIACRKIFHRLIPRYFGSVCPGDLYSWPERQGNGKIIWDNAIIKFSRWWGNGDVKHKVEKKPISYSVSAITLISLGEN